MRPVHWDEGFHYDDPNLFWGDEQSYYLEPGDVGYVSAPPTSRVPKPRKNKSTMNADYVPQSYKNLQAWLTKQGVELDLPLATTIGMTADERTAYQLAVTTLLTPVSVIVALMQQLEKKPADFPLILAAQLPLIRAAIKRAKTSLACTPAIQTSLEWIGAHQNNDP